MMKKFITIGAVLVLSLSMLAGCGNSTSNEADTKTENEVIAEQSSEKNEEVAENSEAIAEVVPETETTDVVDEPEDVVETTEEVPENSEAVEEPVAPKTEYTYSALDKTMYAKSSVNVRDLPSTDGERIGGLSARQEVHVTGQCNETGWYRIAYGDETGYVSNSYIVAEKPAEPQPEPEQPTQPSGNYDGYDEFGNGYVIGADGYKHFDCACPYPINQITDGGSWLSYYGIIGQPAKDTDCKNILEDRYPGSYYDNSHSEFIKLGYYNGQMVYYQKWFY